MTGKHLWEATHFGDAAKVCALLSTQGAQSFINYQNADGDTPLIIAAYSGHESVTKQLIAARCNVDLQTKCEFSPLHDAANNGHETVTKQCAVTSIFRTIKGTRRSTSLPLKGMRP
jgi:ankyrin repeat protein